MPESVFVATLGAEPQVVTLALDALLTQGMDIHRVIVIHTLDDREPIRSSLRRLHQEFIVDQFYGLPLRFDSHLLAGSSGPLADVITPAEIEDAFQSLYTLLRQHKQAGRRIHLCLAGGRKTMALFAMAAAQILFDLNDGVWHLVSHPDLITSKQLHADSQEHVVLIPVPIAYWKHLQPDDQSRVRHFVDTILTPSEREVVQLLIREGLSNAVLAARLGKSAKTIANQLTSTYLKLQQYFDLPDTPDRTMLLVLLGSYS